MKNHFPCGHWHKKKGVITTTTLSGAIIGMNSYSGRLVNLHVDSLARTATYDEDPTNQYCVCFGVTYDYTNNIGYIGINDYGNDEKRIVKVDLTTMTKLDSLVLKTSSTFTLETMCDFPENGYIYATVKDNISPYTTTLYEIAVSTFAVSRTLVFTNPRPADQTNGLFPDSTRHYLYYRGTGNGANESYIRRVNLTTFVEDATTVEVAKGVSDGYYYGIYSDMVYDKATGMIYCIYSSTESPIGTLVKSTIASVSVDTMSVIATQELPDNPVGSYHLTEKMALSDDYIYLLLRPRRSGGIYYAYMETINRTTLAHENFTRIGPTDGTYPYIAGDIAVSGDKLLVYCEASSVSGEVAFYQSYDISTAIPMLLDEVQFLDTSYMEVGSVANMVAFSTTI